LTTNNSSLPLCFIDARGGELARLATGVAHTLGAIDAIALVWGDDLPMSDTVRTVLEEVAMPTPLAEPFDNALTSKYRCIWLGEAPVDAAIADAQVWPAALLHPEKPLFDRLVIARLLRDDIARRIRAAKNDR
jgi:hypothetical protein